MRYLLNDWESIVSRIGDSHIALFVDFDGTLAPIAPTPDEAYLPRHTKSILVRLAASSRCSLAIVSGRQLEDLKSKVGISNIVYIGSHGLEVSGALSSPIFERRKIYEELISWFKRELEKRFAAFKGIIFEDKALSLAVHYRNVKHEDIANIEDTIREIVASLDVGSLLEIVPGKMVLELRPKFGWDKGSALEWILSQEKVIHENKVFPIYIGDDVTDEDGFRAVAGYGLAVFVGEPKSTLATHFVRNTNEVRQFLVWLAELCTEPSKNGLAN